VFLQIGAADSVPQVGGQLTDDVVDGLRHSRERIVGAEDDVLAAEHLHRRVQRVRAVGQRVAPESTGKAAWQVRGVGVETGDHCALVEPADKRRQRPSAVGQADSHVGSPRECAAGDQRRSGHRRLDRHPYAEAKSQIGQPAWKILVARMHEDQCSEFMRNCEEPVQAGVGQLGAADLRADLDTEEPRIAHASAHLVDGRIGILQSDGAQCREASWMLVHDAGEEFVLSRRQLRRARRRRAIAECHRNRRKNLHRNIFTVHVGEPGFG
jgi:hypothetical protein